MITQIGLVAGTILNLLEEKQIPVSLTEIKFYLDEALDVINMSIGWLVRENYLSLPSPGTLTVAVPESSGCALIS